ncbi:MAG TPA: hypothetical protein VJ600_03045 [Holophagaceae bacterium]|nr:hypothetical protein [Holophagaceae bacterium]
MTRAILPLLLPLLSALLAAQTPDTVHLKPDAPPVQEAQPAPKPATAKPEAPKAASAPAPTVVATPAPQATGSLSFFSQSYTYYWDRLIKVDANVDGLKINSIFFNVRKPNVALLRSTEWGTRAQVEVTNAGTRTRIPGFAVAVLDGEGKLLGVATGGSKVTGVKPGETETFDLDFTQVKERLPKGEKFMLSVELRD